MSDLAAWIWNWPLIILLFGTQLFLTFRLGFIQRFMLTHAGFADLSTIGPIVLAFGLATFVFSTILGWSYYGEKAVEYLFGLRAVLPHRLAWVAAVVVGAVLPIQMVWDFSAVANGLMAVPNLISLIVLSGVIAAETKVHRGELTGEADHEGR